MTKPASNASAVTSRADPLPDRTASGDWSLQNRTVVVATNGSAESAAAVRVASELARTRGARPMVVRAYYPGPAWIPPLPPAGLIPDQGAAARADAYQELRRVDPEAGHWPLEVVVGAPEDAIIAKARGMEAALIVMGLHSGGALRRVFGAEILLPVIRRSRCPVLATTQALHALPRHVVVGIDVNLPGLRTAQVAAALAAHGAIVDIVFVDPPHHRTADSVADAATHARRVARAFQDLRERMTPRSDLVIRPVILGGVPGDALRRFAESSDADLVALGTGQHRFLERLLLGSVTETVVREERWSVLTVPPDR